MINTFIYTFIHVEKLTERAKLTKHTRRAQTGENPYACKMWEKIFSEVLIEKTHKNPEKQLGVHETWESSLTVASQFM